MTTETILTDGDIRRIWNDALTFYEFARAIEQAVLQSPEIQEERLMAGCMAMIRQELIEAEVINENVPPMMVSNAVLAEVQALRRDAERWKLLPAFLEDYQINYVRLVNDINAAMEQQK